MAYVPAESEFTLYEAVVVPVASTLDGVQLAPGQYSIATWSPEATVPVTMSGVPGNKKFPAENASSSVVAITVFELLHNELGVVAKSTLSKL